MRTCCVRNQSSNTLRAFPCPESPLHARCVCLLACSIPAPGNLKHTKEVGQPPPRPTPAHVTWPFTHQMRRHSALANSERAGASTGLHRDRRPTKTRACNSKRKVPWFAIKVMLRKPSRFGWDRKRVSLLPDTVKMSCVQGSSGGVAPASLCGISAGKPLWCLSLWLYVLYGTGPTTHSDAALHLHAELAAP